MRDLVVFLVVMAALPVAFYRPFIGLLVFSWLAYMRPQDLCWGFARTMRFSFLAAIVMMVGWMANESGRRRFGRWDLRTTSMVVLGVIVSISFAFAKQIEEYEIRYFIEFLKILLIALFTTGQIDTRNRLRWMFWIIAISLGFYGFKSGIMGVLSGGKPILRGPGGMLEDNNDFALALVMNIPLLYYLGMTEGNRLVRKWCTFTIACTMVAILLTHSRGAFLSLCMCLMWIAWRSGKLFRAIMALFALGLVFLAFAPPHVMERLASIGKGGEDASAGARLRSWKVAFRMIEDNPILGVGLRNFQPRYKEYAGDLLRESKTTYVAHNSYLQIWAESGTPAFMIYLTLLAGVFLTCWKVFKWAKHRPDMEWARNYSRMLEATTVGFMCGAMFLNRGHFDLIYHLFALVSALYLVARQQYVAGPQMAVHAESTGVTVRSRPAAGTMPQPVPIWGASFRR